MLNLIISRYNHDVDWLKDYEAKVIMYDRSEIPLSNAIVVPNKGSDLYDKFTFIIDNYDNLPDVAIYTKCNSFKYISKEEFDRILEQLISLARQLKALRVALKAKLTPNS